MRRPGLIAALAAASLALGTGSASAVSLQPIGSFTEPIYVTSDPADPERLLVVERAGRVVEVRGGARRTLVDITGIVDDGGEGGLLSVAAAPQFGTDGRLFLFYTGNEQTPPEIHVAELRLGAALPAWPADLRNLVTISHPDDTNHYGGQLQIGSDGYLYASTGDGGGSNDQYVNAQNASSRLGKLLRIDPSTEPAGVQTSALGLRNPYRFSFDRATGDLWIGDVGQGQWEEINHVPFAASAGANFGWACREGSVPGPRNGEAECAALPSGSLTDPVFAYPNPAGGCAVIGGYVVRDPSLPELYGRYVYGDLCNDEIRSFDPAAPGATDRFEGLTVDRLFSFGEDACRRVYAISGNGGVWRLGNAQVVCLVEQAPIPPSISATPRVEPPPRANSRLATHLRIRAAKRRVSRGTRARITVIASPCPELRGHRVSLWRGRKRIGTRPLNANCRAHFKPRITRRSGIRAKLRGTNAHLAAESRRLTIRPVRAVTLVRAAHRRQ